MNRTGGDVCINTWAGLFCGWNDLRYCRGVEQTKVKVTREGAVESRFQAWGWDGMVFAGYNDAGFEKGGARRKRDDLFPEFCRFEADGEGWAG